MTDLADWLLIQIAEDEAVARRTRAVHSAPGKPINWAVFCDEFSPDARGHQMRWHPDRVLAECEAKRFVIEMLRQYEDYEAHRSGELETVPDVGERANNPAGALRRMALPYADRPGYRDEWRPSQ